MPETGEPLARIREVREKRRLSQTSLARMTGISQTHLSMIELGKRVNIHPRILAHIARALDVSVDYLLGLTDQEEPYPRRDDAENEPEGATLAAAGT